MQLSTIARVGIVLGFVAVLVCGAVAGSAFARDGATYDQIPRNTYCEGVDLGGMDADQAREALDGFVEAAGSTVVVRLVDETNGDVFDMPLEGALVYDVDAAVEAAVELNHTTPVLRRLAGTEPERTDVPLTFKVDEGVLYDQIAQMTGTVHVDPADAWREFHDDNTVTVHYETIGRDLDVQGTFESARNALASQLSATTTYSEALAADLTAPLAASYTTPYLTAAEMAPAIIVDYAAFKLYVYELEKCTWWCWIGYGRGYDPTYNATYDSPTGLHYIEYKDPAPVWTNPDPNGWGSGRPAVIEAGPDNPLGLRALKISDAPMIYIHGVNYTYLLGQRLSHGCINVYNDQIVELYDMLPDPLTIKDQIWVYFHDYPETSDYAEMIGYSSSSSSSSYSYDDSDASYDDGSYSYSWGDEETYTYGDGDDAVSEDDIY